jgi:hypothetical protein
LRSRGGNRRVSLPADPVARLTERNVISGLPWSLVCGLFWRQRSGRRICFKANPSRRSAESDLIAWLRRKERRKLKSVGWLRSGLRISIFEGYTLSRRCEDLTVYNLCRQCADAGKGWSKCLVSISISDLPCREAKQSQHAWTSRCHYCATMLQEELPADCGTSQRYCKHLWNHVVL